MDLFNELEEALPVADWQAEGLRVWPIVRERLWWSYNADYARHRIRVSAASPVRRRVIRSLRLGQDLARWGAAHLADRQHQASLRVQSDAVLLGDNVSRIWLEGAWYDRLCEPFSEVLHEMGLRTLHLDPHHVYRRPKHDASVFIQPRLDALWVRARADRSPRAAELQGYDAFVARLREAGHDPSVVDTRSTLSAARRIRHCKDWFVALLRGCGARVGFVVDYNHVSMAFAAACRELGLPAVEIQHGVQGELHWAYGRWRSVPAAGYELLPSVYWTWSAAEAVVIDDWAAASNGRHRAVVGGNLFLRKWRDEGGGMVQRYDERLRPPAGVTATVLWTLQPGFSDDQQLRLLQDAVLAGPTSWRWWVRLHPTMSQEERQHIRASLPVLPAVHLDEPSEAPLYALLRATSVHVTHSSSTVIEAAEFGVATVLTSDAGALLYPQAVADGIATIGATPEALLAALEAHVLAGVRQRRSGDAAPAADLLLRDLVRGPLAP